MVLGIKSFNIQAGDFIFIPKNLDHKIRKYDSAGILKVAFFMDKPGLLEFFKERHKQFYMDKKTYDPGRAEQRCRKIWNSFQNA